MKTLLSITLVTLFISFVDIQCQDTVINLSNYDEASLNFNCGGTTPSNSQSGIKDSIVVCLIFPDMKPVPRKVVFNPRVDNFEMLQISGLYDLLANLTTTDLRMFAMSNGVISRPILIKRQDKVAQLVNLRIEMNNGAIQKLEWINVCDDLACENNICIDTQELWRNTTYYDSNCFLYGCTSSVNSQCDTKVYLTFIGEDREGRVFTSDNYRLSNFKGRLFVKKKIAKSVGGGIYSKVFG